ncbi:hypothetical protein C0991_008954 [Blastosporella zonata]|nr:hypothetical protein C0991_008954 [Blastosporella zonata]
MWPFGPSYLKIVDAKKAKQQEALARAVPPILSPGGDEKFINATEIVSRIQKRDWTASQVVEAYIAQAAKAHAITNCLTEGLCLPEVPLERN